MRETAKQLRERYPDLSALALRDSAIIARLGVLVREVGQRQAPSQEERT
jgi:hypothetical protein